MIFEGLAGLAALGLACVAIAVLRRRSLDRKADSAWESAWERVEPAWSGRNRRRPSSGER